MLTRMMTRMRLFALLALAATALLFSACAGGGALDGDKYAWRMEGGALTEYGGSDGGNAAARNLMRLLLVGRQFDFTPVDNRTVAPGDSHTYRGSADGDFGDAAGTQNQIGDAMTALFTVPTTNPELADVELSAAFSKAEAEDTYADAGQSFTVTWTLSYTEGGEARELTAQQSLIGVNYMLD
jgi:hypothetical protein